jgi:hypothetical protein
MIVKGDVEMVACRSVRVSGRWQKLGFWRFHLLNFTSAGGCSASLHGERTSIHLAGCSIFNCG